MNLTIEEMKKIVDDAPEWADTWLLPDGEYCSIGIQVDDGVYLSLSKMRSRLNAEGLEVLRDVDIPPNCIVIDK